MTRPVASRLWLTVVVATTVALGLLSRHDVQAVDYFASNCDGAAYPLCGFASEDTTNYGTYVNRTRVTDGCPDGTDAVHFEMIPVGTHTQFNYGWSSGAISGWNPGNGDTFYLKYRVRPNATINWTGNEPEPVFDQKFILFSADIDSQRFITGFRENGGNNTAGMQSQLNVGGGPTAALTLGSWNAVIQGYTLATTNSANDGILRTWVATSGAFTFGSPTSTQSTLDLEDNAGRTGFDLGRFTQTTLGSGGSFGYDICNVVLSDVFDASWPSPTETFYVSKSGNDGNSCETAKSTTQTLQKLTIAAGLACLSAGDTLLIHSGTYTETLLETSFGGSGTSSAPITVAAYPGDTVTLRPTTGLGNVARFQDGSISYVTLDRLTLDGVNAGGGAGGGVVYLGPSSHHIRLTNLEITNGDGNGVTAEGANHAFLDLNVHRNGLFAGYNISNGLYLQCDTSLVRGGTFHNNESFGIRVFHSAGTTTGTTVERTTVYNNGQGIGLDGTATGSSGGGIILADTDQVAVNNKVYDNFSGIWAYTDSLNVQLYHNTIYSNTNEGLALQFYTTPPVLRNNISYQNGDDYEDYTSGSTPHSSNLIGSDPGFQSAGTFNFQLTAGSAARNTGTTVATVTTDFTGVVSRPQEGTYDIGAYEYVPPGTFAPARVRRLRR